MTQISSTEPVDAEIKELYNKLLYVFKTVLFFGLISMYISFVCSFLDEEI